MATLYVGSARIDENGRASGGSAGDQTGREVATEKYYMHSQGWYLLRPKSVTHANAIAAAMIRACNNNKIGYDQYNRLGIIKYGTKTTTKTECDCSSLVRQCVIEATGKDPGNFTTANEATCLVNTGLFNSKVSVTSSTTLYNGDILVTKTKGHTVVVTSGNPRSTTSTSTTTTVSSSSTSSSTYYNKYTGTSGAIDTVLAAIGVPSSYRGSWSKRKPLATANGISNYTGTANQNITLINLAKQGKLKKVSSSTTTTSTYYNKYTGTSGAIDTVLKAIGVPSTYYGNWSKRKPLAAKNGISNYTGTANQNITLINLAKQGKLKRV